MASRREFCKKTFLAAGACSLGGAFFLEACSSTSLALADTYTIIEKELKVQLSAFGTKKQLVFDDKKLEHPIYVSKLEDGTYRAFLMQCTHRGCTVQAQGSIMVCPCHGAEFNNNGKVLAGPASESLPEFKTSKNTTELTVYIK